MYFLSPLIIYAMYRPSWQNRRFLANRYRGVIVPALLSLWVVVLRLAAAIDNVQDSGNYNETDGVCMRCVEEVLW